MIFSVIYEAHSESKESFHLTPPGALQSGIYWYIRAQHLSRCPDVTSETYPNCPFFLFRFVKFAAIDQKSLQLCCAVCFLYQIWNQYKNSSKAVWNVRKRRNDWKFSIQLLWNAGCHESWKNKSQTAKHNWRDFFYCRTFFKF